MGIVSSLCNRVAKSMSLSCHWYLSETL